MDNHSHQTGSNSKNLIAAISLNVVIVIFEIIFGVLARSMALISDALHNFTDIGSMSLSLWGEKVAERPQDQRKTYGYKRAEVIIAFVNGGILLGVAAFVIIESVQRFLHPEPVSGLKMLIVAAIALLGNGIATYLLEKDSHKNLNLKSAWLHSMQDALFSLGVIAGAAVIYYTGWNWIDPLASILISLFLLKEVYGIMKASVNMMMDSVPEDLDFSLVKSAIAEMAGVESVEDLHIWQTGSHSRFISAHLKIAELDEPRRMELLAKIQVLMAKQFNINHATMQMVSAKEAKLLDLACQHCN